MDNKLYVLIIRRALHGEGGPKYGTKFDLDVACEICGTGAKQVGPLLVKSSEIPKNKELVETLDHEILFSENFRHLFETQKVKGIHFIKVLNYKDNNPLDYWQLEPMFSLPPLDSESRGIITENQCPKCKKDGFFDTLKEKQQYVYATLEETLLRSADMFTTWEHFGNSSRVEDPPNPPGVFKPRRIIHFAKPRIIVNEKVKKLFEEIKIKGVEFETVRVKEIL